MATSQFNAATYNAYYKANDKTLDEFTALLGSNDIVGTQEVTHDGLKAQVHNAYDTHLPFIGEAQNGPHDGEYSPIFYNRQKFEAVHTESVRLHEANYAGINGPGRVANFALLRDKSTNATVLAVNTHWANGNDEAQMHARQMIDSKINEIRQKYPVDGVVAVGDFNTHIPQLADMTHPGPYSYPTHEGGGHLDHVLTGFGAQGAPIASVKDGGDSDHNSVSRGVTVTSKQDPRKATLTRHESGALMYQDANYSGNMWISGYGTTLIDKRWNDEITSFKVTSNDNDQATFMDHSQNDARFNTPQNASFVSGSIAGVPREWNDRISFITYNI